MGIGYEVQSFRGEKMLSRIKEFTASTPPGTGLIHLA